MTQALFSARGLSVEYAARGGRTVQALHSVDVDVMTNETLALVGESGSGKSTLGRALIRMADLSAGAIRFRGADITALRGGALKRLRRHIQVIFQDPFDSLNPRLSVGRSVAEPLIVHGLARGDAARRRVAECLALVGLEASAAGRLPAAFSGGQRQRVAIARAIAAEPDFILADEPLSSLDATSQMQMVELFQDLKRRLGLTYLFISHDLTLVARFAHRAAVMHLGTIVEIAPAATLLSTPLHPYTQALAAAIPRPDPATERHRRPVRLHGELPSPASPPDGCRFHTRCPLVEDVCRTVAPPLAPAAPNHLVACHLAAAFVAPSTGTQRHAAH